MFAKKLRALHDQITNEIRKHGKVQTLLGPKNEKAPSEKIIHVSDCAPKNEDASDCSDEFPVVLWMGQRINSNNILDFGSSS